MTGVLVHGGDAAHRRQLFQALRAAAPHVPVRVSSQAVEAAKCLADTVVTLVVLLDDSLASHDVRRIVADSTRAIRVRVCEHNASVADTLTAVLADLHIALESS